VPLLVGTFIKWSKIDQPYARLSQKVGRQMVNLHPFRELFALIASGTTFAFA
jgi:hypothetical protein